MRILVICGSPKGENSDTSRLTRAFLEGMGEEAKWVYAYNEDIKPCLGCFSCWNDTPGKCVHEDAMTGILEEICAADMVIWSTPQYCYGVPGPLKTLIDRILPLSTAEQAELPDGQIYHPKRVTLPKMMLIAGCGFGSAELNSEPIKLQFGYLFGRDIPYIYCAEAPLLSMPSASIATRPYIAAVKQAGAEMKECGRISEETQAKLDKPMVPQKLYASLVNAAAQAGVSVGVGEK